MMTMKEQNGSGVPKKLALPVVKVDHHSASLLTGLGIQHADEKSEKNVFINV